MRQYQLLVLGFGWAICTGCSGDTGMTPSNADNGTVPNDSQVVPNDSQAAPNSGQLVPNDSQPPPSGGQVSGPNSAIGAVDCSQLCSMLVAGNCLSNDECSSMCAQGEAPNSACHPELSAFADCMATSTLVCEQAYDFVQSSAPCSQQANAYGNCIEGAVTTTPAAQCTTDDGCLGCTDACEACVCGMQAINQDTSACDMYCNG